MRFLSIDLLQMQKISLVTQEIYDVAHFSMISLCHIWFAYGPYVFTMMAYDFSMITYDFSQEMETPQNLHGPLTKAIKDTKEI